MESKPEREHEWLMQLVGSWEFENECAMGPGGEKVRGTGREVVRAIGGLWVVGEMTGEMPGCGEMVGIMTLGFDPGRKKFVGTWIGSPTTHMFIYEGTLDDARRVLTLDCTGPSFTDPAATARYQDIIEVRSRDERRLASQVLGEDGKWTRFMEGVFRRIG